MVTVRERPSGCGHLNRAVPRRWELPPIKMHCSVCGRGAKAAIDDYMGREEDLMKKVAVAMSGGVDSAVAALLLGRAAMRWSG